MMNSMDNYKSIFQEFLQIFPYPIEITGFEPVQMNLEITFRHKSHSEFYFELCKDFINIYYPSEVPPDVEGTLRYIYNRWMANKKRMTNKGDE